MNKRLAILLALVLARPAAADALELEFELPALDVDPYHRPFVAVWLEDAEGRARTVAVWYDDPTWLKDLRRWWRAVAGRAKEADGYSGATRPPGRHRLRIAPLPPAPVTVYLEVAREEGGRSLWRGRFDPGRPEPEPIETQVGGELGHVRLRRVEENEP